jgi:hypothetical protein
MDPKTKDRTLGNKRAFFDAVYMTNYLLTLLRRERVAACTGNVPPKPKCVREHQEESVLG